MPPTRSNEIPGEGGNPDVGKRAIFGLGHHQAQQQVRRRDRRPTETLDRGSGLYVVQGHRSQRPSRTSWFADARDETRHVWETDCRRGGDARGAARGVGFPLKILVWEDGNGAVSVSYNPPGFMAETYRLDGALRAPFDAIESIVEAVVGP